MTQTTNNQGDDFNVDNLERLLYSLEAEQVALVRSMYHLLTTAQFIAKSTEGEHASMLIGLLGEEGERILQEMMQNSLLLFHVEYNRSQPRKHKKPHKNADIGDVLEYTLRPCSNPTNPHKLWYGEIKFISSNEDNSRRTYYVRCLDFEPDDTEIVYSDQVKGFLKLDEYKKLLELREKARERTIN